MEAPGHVPSVPSPKSGTDYTTATVSLSFCSNTFLYAAKMPHRSSDSSMNSVKTACMSRASVHSL